MNNQKMIFTTALADECSKFMQENNVSLNDFEHLVKIDYMPSARSLAVSFLGEVIITAHIENFGTKEAVLVLNGEKRIRLEE